MIKKIILDCGTRRSNRWTQWIGSWKRQVAKSVTFLDRQNVSNLDFALNFKARSIISNSKRWYCQLASNSWLIFFCWNNSRKLLRTCFCSDLAGSYYRWRCSWTRLRTRYHRSGVIERSSFTSTTIRFTIGLIWKVSVFFTNKSPFEWILTYLHNKKDPLKSNFKCLIMHLIFNFLLQFFREKNCFDWKKYLFTLFCHNLTFISEFQIGNKCHSNINVLAQVESGICLV